MKSYKKPPKWLHMDGVTLLEQISYARASMNHCEGDVEGEAIRSGFTAGVHWAMDMIAERIRAELVCCPSEHIDAMRELMHEHDGRPMSSFYEFHPICYWGEMSARLAEDPHSLLMSPYECRGQHPGECWRSREGEEDEMP